MPKKDRRESLFAAIFEEQKKAGFSTTEISEFQNKFQYVPLKSILKELTRLAGVNKEFNVEALKSYILVSEAKVANVKNKRKKRVEPNIVDALIPLLTENDGDQLLRIKLGDTYSYDEVKDLLSYMLTRYFNTSNTLRDNEIKLAYIITDEATIKGRVISRVESSKKNIPLISAYRGRHSFVYSFFGSKDSSYRGYKKACTYSTGFWVYKFITEDEEEVYLLSTKEMDIDEYTIKGMPVNVSDMIKISTLAKVSSQTKIMFVYSADRLTPLLNDDNAWKRLMKWDSEEVIYSKFFGNYPQPLWFKRLLASWQFSCKLDNMPTHLSILSEPSLGKTKSILGTLSEVYRTNAVSGGTVKGLIPSFGTGKPEEGYFLKCTRIGLVDEFIHILRNSEGSSQGGLGKGSAELLKILEHSEDEYRSAYGVIRGKPRMWCMFCSNIKPYEHIRNLVDLHSKLNAAFMSRMVWYVFNKEHIEFINKHKPDVMMKTREELMPKYSTSVLSVVDYMRSKKARGIKRDKIVELIQEFRPYVPTELLTDIYDSRMVLHAYRLLDGYAKYKSIAEHRGKLVCTDKDFEEFREIFKNIVLSWSFNLEKDSLPIAMRVKYLNEKDRKIFEFVELNKGITGAELKIQLGSDAYEIARELLEKGFLRTIKNTLRGSEEFYTFSQTF